jgi:hypothetical protein
MQRKIPFYERCPEWMEGRNVRVYYNLRTHCWSVKDRDTKAKGHHKGKGLVLCHTRQIALSTVTPYVSEAGRQRVIREQRKNVHAFLDGFVRYDITCDESKYDDIGRVGYNPYVHDSFVIGMTKKYLGSDMAFLSPRGHVTACNFRKDPPPGRSWLTPAFEVRDHAGAMLFSTPISFLAEEVVPRMRDLGYQGVVVVKVAGGQDLETYTV